MISVFLALLLALTNAHPLDKKVYAENVATAPVNCRDAIQWVNGTCREIIPNEVKDQSIDVNNIITVPPNCPPGFEWINGACREVWIRATVPAIDWNRNVVTVPPNCPPGQEWINGQCRDVWPIKCRPEQKMVNGRCLDVLKKVPENWEPKNIVTVPPNCPPGQEWINGQCRDVWPIKCRPEQELVNGRCLDVLEKVPENWEPKNIVTLPPNCPPGFEWINGACREVWIRATVPPIDWNRNVVTVPPNCPPGQEWINGQCRDVWPIKCRPEQKLVNGRCLDVLEKVPENWEPKNMVTVPPNCPPGQEYINGKCTEVWMRKDGIEPVQCAFGEVINGECVNVKGLLINAITRSISKREIPDDEVELAEGVNEGEKGTSRKVVNVPNQCPAGYKADANGICRQMWF